MRVRLPVGLDRFRGTCRLEARCRREIGDLLYLRNANLAAVMQMDIDAPIVALRETEHDAKLAEHIAALTTTSGHPTGRGSQAR